MKKADIGLQRLHEEDYADGNEHCKYEYSLIRKYANTISAVLVQKTIMTTLLVI